MLICMNEYIHRQKNSSKFFASSELEARKTSDDDDKKLKKTRRQPRFRWTSQKQNRLISIMASILSRTMARRMAPRLFARPALISTIRPTAQRSMVMVTKTSAGETSLQVEQPSAVTNNTSSGLSVDTDQLQVTESCMRRIQSLAEKRNETLDEVYLRVYVDAGGCSGFQYKFEMTKDDEEAIDAQDDTVFTADSGARVVVDSASMDLIQGSTIDFVQEMIKSAFAVVDNPKSESACGCGSSFAVKNFEANPALD